MSRSNWRSKFALGGIVLALALSGPVHAKEPKWVRVECPPVKEQAAKNTQQSAKNRECLAAPIAVIETPEQSADSEERERKSDEHEAADLKAQQQAAEAAGRSAASAERQEVPAIAQVVFAVVGTLIGLLAFRNTLRSDRLNRETTQAQLRAYVLLEKYHLSVSVDQLDINTVFFVLSPDITIKNFGQTPASDLTVSLHFEIWDVPHLGAEYEAPHPVEARESRGLLGPGAPVIVTPEEKKITLREFEMLRDGTKKAYVWGVADYVDVFGEDQTLTFRLVNLAFKRTDTKVIPLSPCAEGNSSTPHKAKRHEYLPKWM